MTRIEIINDLKLIKNLLETTWDYAPSAIEYAIDIIKTKPEIQVKELEEEDFYDELPFWMKEEEPNV